ncbi:hypothetical protein A5676_21020 [Mycobacterium malmoense]|nr:hypothetical protein A5676_21020 [Mycobacterium malmoense]
MLAIVIKVGKHHVGWFDIPVEKTLFVGVVECAGDRSNDTNDFFDRHTGRVSIGQETGGIESVDIVHGDPQLTVFFATVVHADDVGMPECGSEIGFPVEPCSILGIG